MVEFKLDEEGKPSFNLDDKWVRDMKIRTPSEWEADYIALKAEGKKLWTETGLPDDIRKGWQQAAKENKLFAFGPYSVPLDVVEAIEDDTRQMLRNAGIHKKPEHADAAPSTYVQILKDKIKGLEEDVCSKQKQIDTLLTVITDLRFNKGSVEVDFESDQRRLSGAEAAVTWGRREADDEVTLF